MEPTKKQKDEVQRNVKKWKRILYLQDWHFTFTFLHENEDEYAAKIVMNQSYRFATIVINPRFWDEKDKSIREMAVCHELCHCIVKPVAQMAEDAANGHGVSQRELMHWVEYVTQHITNVAFYQS